MHPITIRPIRSTETSRVLDVLHAAHRWNLANGFNFTAATITADELIPRLAPDRFFVAERQGQVVGTIEIKPETVPGLWTFHLLAADPKADGKGIGSALIAFAETHARRYGATTLRLDTPESHPWLPTYYERLGFRRTGSIQWEGKRYRSIFLDKALRDEGSMKRLILFDIDGTLLSAHGAGKRSFGRGLMDVFGKTGPIDGWNFGGKTDRLLVRELLGAAGLPSPVIEDGIDRAIERYLSHLEAALVQDPGHVLPGVFDLLNELAGDPTVTLGLLTGNVEAGAKLKLSALGLEEYFRLGSYGCDSANRRELPAVAIERALAVTGQRFSGKEVVIIGDTPFDIDCGKVLHNRTIAVATGSFSLDDLLTHEPDFGFETLEPIDAVLQAIRAEVAEPYPA